MNASSWNAEREQELARLWAEGHSTSEIGRRLNLSKNGICGKVNRLGLTPRGSPIKRYPGAERTPAKPRAPRAPKVTLPAIAAAPQTVLSASLVLTASVPHSDEIKKAFVLTSRQCQWLDGQRGAYRQCEGLCQPLSSYCPTHHAISYQPASTNRVVGPGFLVRRFG